MTAKISEKNKSKRLAVTLDLLQQGGDDRIVSVSGRNEYDCRLSPDPDLISFASSTASTISESGLAAADNLRKRIGNSLNAATYSQELDRVRNDIISLCDLRKFANLKIVFSASGTDAHLIASRLIVPGCVIAVQDSETGKGVSTALAGRHFSTRSAYCSKISKGESLGRDRTCPIISVSIRNHDGNPRDIRQIDDEVTAHVKSKLINGLKVLVVIVDVSKTGMIAPSLSCVLKLQEQFPELIEVLIDACQFRLAHSTLKAYLKQGFMVAVTGSKFLTGPAFSGALLIPETVRNLKLPVDLSAYTSKCEWPAEMQSGIPGSGTNFGLLLRWESALAELREFSNVSESAIKHFLANFADAVSDRIETDQNLEALSVPILNRSPVAANDRWDHVQTIFPFYLIKNGKRLKPEETHLVFSFLQQDLSRFSNHPLAAFRCSLGQPVSCGIHHSVLRLCSSARLVVEGWQNSSLLIDRAFLVFEKINLILQRWDLLNKTSDQLQED